MKGPNPNISLNPTDLSVLDLNTEYRSLKEDPVKDFYARCLTNSICYKRAVGYFRSTVYSAIGAAIVEFSRRGGHTELICSPELTEEDIDSIRLGYAQKSETVERALIQQIEELLASKETSFNTRVLATLVSTGALEIKVALRADKKGLYHEKLGIFLDSSGNAVTFKGSANETFGGWHNQGNFESIEVFCSWRGGQDAERVRRHKAHFERLWSETDPDIEVFSFPADAIVHLKQVAFDDLDRISPHEMNSGETRRIALPHQEIALRNWLSRGGRGIFAHATGSGKTFSALMAIRHHIERRKPVIVVVPSRLLLDQWAKEIRNEIPDAPLLLAGGGNETWRAHNRLGGMTAADLEQGGRIVLATMQTAATKKFLREVVAGEHLLLVADEVHQIGSPQHSRILNINAGLRLGLSATPTRYGDPDGSHRLLNYFGGIVLPRISLGDAIEAGRLVPYEYFPHALNLTTEETAEWKSFTHKISREIGRQRQEDNVDLMLSPRAKMLLIQRARIAKKAANKLRVARDVLNSFVEEGQSWLVYCEDASQLQHVRSTLLEDGIELVEYHSKMRGDRSATMSWFRSFGGILVSIRCLDEGVDIPDVSHALILASSQNPRQFIQRRGRVLRRAPQKHIAVVHDAIVIPASGTDEPDQFGLLKSELVRAMEFAKHAMNKSSGAELRDIAINLGIDPEELIESGIEVDEEEI